jgi:hypothetical protein
MADVIVAVDKPQFVKNTHELTSLFKLLDAGSTDAVELIVKTMNAKDDEVGLKMRIQCAEKIIDLKIKVAETISKDQLTRQIAEIKVNGIPPPSGSTADRPRGPVIDFDNIQKV